MRRHRLLPVRWPKTRNPDFSTQIKATEKEKERIFTIFGLFLAIFVLFLSFSFYFCRYLREIQRWRRLR
ncbi:hypothetical protein V6Z12_A01G230400 [Gossypium hirsutum]